LCFFVFVEQQKMSQRFVHTTTEQKQKQPQPQKITEMPHVTRRPPMKEPPFLIPVSGIEHLQQQSLHKLCRKRKQITLDDDE